MPLWFMFLFRALPAINFLIEFIKRKARNKRAALSEKLKAILKRHETTRDEASLKEDLNALKSEIEDES